ncbi:MAG: hypothetical protein KGZ85_05490 [Ignavibacterium sp.]|nr:hypothetical protein [Ignavibacterium sp.]
MNKVIFTIQYEIKVDKREEYLSSIKELKLLVKADGLENYSVYEVKGKKTNVFEEVFIFISKEAFDNFDDGENERMDILVSKIEDMKLANSTHYNTLIELDLN